MHYFYNSQTKALNGPHNGIIAAEDANSVEDCLNIRTATLIEVEDGTITTVYRKDVFCYEHSWEPIFARDGNPLAALVGKAIADVETL